MSAPAWRRRLDLIVPLAIAAALLVVVGTQWGDPADRSTRCGEACAAYMQGEPGVQWVAPHADGPGYNALLACMNEGMAKGLSVEGMTCWPARVDACRIACARAEVVGPSS